MDVNNVETLTNDSCQRHENNCCCHDGEHTHEILGSTLIASRCRDCHNHRFATVSDKEMRSGNSHVHKIKFKTDSYEGHFHEFEGITGPAINIPGTDRHIHFLKAWTKEEDGHKHEFRFATLIDNPIGD